MYGFQRRCVDGAHHAPAQDLGPYQNFRIFFGKFEGAAATLSISGNLGNVPLLRSSPFRREKMRYIWEICL